MVKYVQKLDPLGPFCDKAIQDCGPTETWRHMFEDFGPTGVHATANLDPDLAPPRPGDFLYWKLGVFLWAYDGAFWRSTANPWKNELQRDEEPRHAGAVRNDVFDKAGGRKLQKWLRALQRTPLCLKSF